MSEPVPRSRIEIRASALHGGFGSYPESLVELCERVANDVGIHVDPIFGGKTWSVLEAELDSSKRALFWHCGYTPEWRLLRSRSAT